MTKLLNIGGQDRMFRLTYYDIKKLILQGEMDQLDEWEKFEAILAKGLTNKESGEVTVEQVEEWISNELDRFMEFQAFAWEQLGNVLRLMGVITPELDQSISRKLTQLEQASEGTTKSS